MLVFESLHNNHGYMRVSIDSILPDYERRFTPIPFSFNIYGADIYRVCTCPTCGSYVKSYKLKKNCHNIWHNKLPKGRKRGQIPY